MQFPLTYDHLIFICKRKWNTTKMSWLSILFVTFNQLVSTLLRCCHLQQSDLSLFICCNNSLTLNQFSGSGIILRVGPRLLYSCSLLCDKCLCIFNRKWISEIADTFKKVRRSWVAAFGPREPCHSQDKMDFNCHWSYIAHLSGWTLQRSAW